MNKYKIATIAGDGIGQEVLPESINVLKEAAKKHQFKIQFDEFDFASCEYYQKNGKMLPDDWIPIKAMKTTREEPDHSLEKESSLVRRLIRR